MATPARSTLLSLTSSATSPPISPPVTISVDASATIPAENVERTMLAVLRRITRLLVWTWSSVTRGQSSITTLS